MHICIIIYVLYICIGTYGLPKVHVKENEQTNPTKNLANIIITKYETITIFHAMVSLIS